MILGRTSLQSALRGNRILRAAVFSEVKKKPMLRFPTLLRHTVAACSAVFVVACSAQGGQTPALQPPSTLVRPALESVGRAGSAVDLNKWKGSAATRDDVDANLVSMQKDLQSTLPPLLTAADAAPDSAAASLPVLLNMDALYSVLLRVTIASRSVAPHDENTALEQAAVLLDSARRDLGEAILTATRAQEKRIADLQATVQQQAATMAATATVPAESAPAARPKRKKTASSTKPPTAP